jgi:putative sterol carrier protein
MSSKRIHLTYAFFKIIYMTKKFSPQRFCFSLFFVFCTIRLSAQNPFITHIYAADPSAHVWPNDTNTLWLFTSHDEPGTNHHATMFDYHVFSTKDLVHWIDHGRVLSVDDVDWAISHAWATDAVYWKGNYYFVFCMRDKENSDLFRIGLAISDRPEGPFKSIGQIRGVEQGMDPSIFVDDDNQPYLIFAHNRKCYIGKLSDDLLSVSELKIIKELPQLQEGPWLHKYNGKYYLSYPGLRNDQWPEVMYYSVADKIMDTYVPMGQYIPYFEGQAGSNHGSIVKFKDKWIAFYHSAILSKGNGYERSLMADFLFYDKDGKIIPIIPSKNGITQGKTVECIIQIEAENGSASGGKLMGTYTESILKGYSGHGYVTGFNHNEEYVEVLVQLAKDQKYAMEIFYSAGNDKKIAVCVNDFMLNGDYAAWKDIILPKSQSFTSIVIGEVELKKGDNKVRIQSYNGDFKLDKIVFKPIINN